MKHETPRSELGTSSLELEASSSKHETPSLELERSSFTLKALGMELDVWSKKLMRFNARSRLVLWAMSALLVVSTTTCLA